MPICCRRHDPPDTSHVPAVTNQRQATDDEEDAHVSTDESYASTDSQHDDIVVLHLHRPDCGRGHRLSYRTLATTSDGDAYYAATDAWTDLRRNTIHIYDVDKSYYDDIYPLPPVRVIIVIANADFAGHPNMKGVMVLLRIMAIRELKAVPLARTTSMMGLLHWARLLHHCSSYGTFECHVWCNGRRLSGSTQIQLHHGDYIRIEAKDRQCQQRDPVLVDIPEPHMPCAQTDQPCHWPMQPSVFQAVPRRNANGHNVRDHLHADYWIYMSWWVSATMVIMLLMLPKDPSAKPKRRRRNAQGYRTRRNAALLILLILADHTTPAATMMLLHPRTSTSDPIHRFPAQSGHSLPTAIEHFIDPTARLPPPGNPDPVNDATCTYEPEVAQEIWLKIGRMYRPVATPARSTKALRPCQQISLNAALATVEDAQGFEESDHNSLTTGGLDASHNPPSFSMFLGENVFDQHCGLQCPWPDTTAPWPTDFIEEIHPATYEVLYKNIALADDDLVYLHIFTDGSAGKNNDGWAAAWAFAIFESPTTSSDLTGARYLTWYGAHVEADALSPQWVGAVDLTSKAAETEALLWALLWILQAADPRRVTIHTDAVTVLHAATGRWGFSLEEPHMRRLRSTQQLISSLLGDDQVTCCHIKAHNGHPGNELADSIAVAIRHDPTIAHAPDVNVARWYHGDTPLIEWAWTIADQYNRPEEVPTYRDGYIHWTDSRAGDYQPWLQLPTLYQQSSETATVTLDCTMISYNVSSLKRVACAAYLRQQLHYEGIAIAGLQETRSSQNDVPDSDYIRIIAAADSGTGGCELWCSKVIPIGHDGDNPLHLSRSLLQVLHEDPQLLLVHADIPHFPILFVVAHAPHTGKGKAQQRSWWNQLQKLLLQHGAKSHKVLLIDANTQLAIDPPHVGRNGQVEPTGAAQDFGQILVQQELFVPLTFPELHVGSHQTWTSNDGLHSTCIDYIAVPLDWTGFWMQSRIFEHIDSGAGGIDHRAIGLHLQGTIMTQPPPKKQRTFDRDKIAKATDTQWKEFYQALPSIPWCHGPTEHATIMNQAIVDQLAKQFPMDPKTSKRGIIFANATWKLHAERGRLRKVLAFHGKALDRLHLHLSMQELKGVPSLKARHIVVLCYAIKMAALHTIYGDVHRDLRRFIAHDRALYLQGFAKALDHADKATIMKRLKPLRLGKRVKDLGLRPLPMVYLEDGTLATTATEARDRWRRHYSAMEGGTEISQKDLWYEDLRTRPPPRHQIELASVPTLTELEYQVRASRPSKAMGYDQLPPELLHFSPQQLSQYVWPLFLKQTLLASECLQHKGGRLISAYKKRGDSRVCANCRALLVSSSLGKSFHNTYRRRVLGQMRQIATPLQVTAHQSPSVALAAHIVRAHTVAARIGGYTDYAMFLDIAQAFYKVIRQQAFDCTYADEDVLKFLTRMGIDDFCLEDVARLLEQGSTLATSGCDPFLHSQVAEVHRNTWFVLQGDASLIRTERGTRPGDGFADVIWSLIFSRWAARFEKRLLQEELARPYEWNGQAGVLSESGAVTVPHAVVIWADDVVVHGSSVDAEKAPLKLQQTCVVMVQELLKFGLLANFDKGKTEAVLSLRGRNSQGVKRLLYNTMHGELPLDTPMAGNPKLRLVPKYKHVGGWVTVGAKLRPELVHRAAQAHQLYQTYRTKVFNNPSIAVDARLAVLNATAITTLHYNAGTWSHFTQYELKFWYSTHLKLYRGALLRLYPRQVLLHMTDEQVLIATGQMHPTATLRALRLRWYGGAVRRDCPQLWACLAMEKEWLGLVQQDLTWLYAQLRGFTNLPDPVEDIYEWHTLMTTRPRRWSGIIKRAMLHDWLQWTMRYKVVDYHRRALEALRIAGASVPDNQLEWSNAAYFCFICSKEFQSYRAWAVHSFKTHGRINKWRRLQHGTTCLSCGRNFTSESRMTRHLRSVSHCARRVAALNLWVDPQPYFGSKVVRMEEEQMALTIIWEDRDAPTDISGESTPMTIELRSLWNLCRQLDWSQSVQTEPILECLRSMPIADDEILEAERMMKHLQPANVDHIDATFRELHGLARPDGMITSRKLTLHECLNGLIAAQEFEPSHIHRLPTKCRYILHLYSGVRRQGDFHGFMEALTPPDGHSFFVASVDLVLDSQLGDLLERKAQDHWLQMSAAGGVWRPTL